MSSLSHTANSHWLSILHMVVYMYAILSIHPILSFPRCVHKSVSISVSPLLPCKWVHQYHLSRFHMHALIYNICLSSIKFLENSLPVIFRISLKTPQVSSSQLQEFSTAFWLLQSHRFTLPPPCVNRDGKPTCRAGVSQNCAQDKWQRPL